MTATLPNRVAGYFPATIATPTTPEARREAWADAVFAAVAFLRSRLESHDPKAAERAAFALIDLEKTRLRHGRDLPSTPPEPKPPRDHGLPPLNDYLSPSAVVLSDDDEDDYEDEELNELEDDDADHSPPLAAANEAFPEVPKKPYVPGKAIMALGELMPQLYHDPTISDEMLIQIIAKAREEDDREREAQREPEQVRDCIRRNP